MDFVTTLGTNFQTFWHHVGILFPMQLFNEFTQILGSILDVFLKIFSHSFYNPPGKQRFSSFGRLENLIIVMVF